MAYDPALADHKAWLGYLQPEGLVVSAAALVDAQVVLDRGTTSELQVQFKGFVEELDTGQETQPGIADFGSLARDFLGWPATCLLGSDGGPPLPDQLIIDLPDLGETLGPDLALVDDHNAAAGPLLLVKLVPPTDDLDVVSTGARAGWSASAAQRFERLLRETGVAIGLLCNGTHLRLVYAPRGESAGSLTWPIRHLCEVAGRPLVGALKMLLAGTRLLTVPSSMRLPALLARSREYQSQVSTALAGQVLAALYELLRGFQSADAAAHGDLLREPLEDDPSSVYAGLLAVLMRLVFLLYAEDKGLLPSTSLYEGNYGVHGLFERLRADHERYADTMDQRYGAWAQLLALFGAVYAGCRHPELAMPARQGHLFDPERYPFLCGATLAEPHIPRLPDGCLYQVLANLLILNGERLSYRTLDVEEIGSVYQTIMGFALEHVAGTAIAVVGQHKGKSEVAAPIIIDLDALLAQPGSARAAWLKQATGHDWSGKTYSGLKDARSINELLTSLDRRIARQATPHPVLPGSFVLQPTDERRRTGSHYTPRQLTEPIVRQTLEPVLAQLGEHPTPEQILNLKVCDPAMGSGAFLVEACRQLAEALVAAWAHHGGRPGLPPDEDELLVAKRLIAQRCLYGVDKNPMAVDLAKLSLWLVTLAKDHPFTFVDHALRAGDSLVGLTRAQIAGFTWGQPGEQVFDQPLIGRRLDEATAARLEILAGGDFMTPALKTDKLLRADDALDLVRQVGDLVVAAFFDADKPKQRERRREDLLEAQLDVFKDADVAALLATKKAADQLRGGPQPITPFHWEIEFPEVFGAGRGGFDAIVGNPPFLGGKRISTAHGEGYRDWLKTLHAETHGNADLVAHFFRRAFGLLRPGGCCGLIATNTIGQGDTRTTGLRWICHHGGTIYCADRRFKWPGEAAVVVSVAYVCRGAVAAPCRLDGREVPQITAYLFHAGGHDDPVRLAANTGRSFQGCILRGMGFTFDDTDTKGVASPVAAMEALVARDPRNAERILPFLGGEEVNGSPTHAHHRYVINFEQMTEAEARQWPELLAIVEAKVKPERDRLKDAGIDATHKRLWWRFANDRPEMHAAIAGLERVLVIAQVSQHHCPTFLPSEMVFSHKAVVVATESNGGLAVLQSRVHEIWARFLGSSLEDRPCYTPSDCFETFPFPPAWEASPALEAIGREYYEYRAKLMVGHDEGMTKTYNRFHDPSERDAGILRLRELHEQMDRAVLEAYGWGDIATTCGYGLDYLDTGDDELSDEAAALLPSDELWWPSAGEATAFAAAVGGRRRLPWRHRWPGAVHDEALARLLALNADRAKQERRAAATTSATRRKRATPSPEAGGLFPTE